MFSKVNNLKNRITESKKANSTKLLDVEEIEYLIEVGELVVMEDGEGSYYVEWASVSVEIEDEVVKKYFE